MLGGLISDLDTGDVFEPVRYTVTALGAGQYTHGMEERCEWFYSAESPWNRQARMPTMVHSDKMRLLEVNCPKEARVSGMTADDARIHYEYDAKHHSVAFVGDKLVISGRIAGRYESRGREYLHYEIEVRTADGRLVTGRTDLLRYRKERE